MKLSLDELLKPCDCGIEHHLLCKDIVLKSGALSETERVLRLCDIFSPVVVFDDNTFKATEKCNGSEYLLGLRRVVLDPEDLHANEHGVEQLENGLKDLKFDGLVAVGSGTVHDITRYYCGKYHFNFVSVPTAASVDGFLSTIAAMTLNGYKISFPSVSPLAVIADTDLYSAAPQRLTASGVSDLLGKYTALADWKISHVLTGERICNRIIDLEMKALDAIKDDAKLLAKGDKDACERLMYGLLLSGLAMQMMGTSRPASGAEHHMSHMWEMEVFNDFTPAYHGEKVGVGLLKVADVYHRLTEIKDIHKYCKKYDGINRVNIERVFGSLSNDVLKQNERDCTANICKERIVQSWDKIVDIVNSIPSVDYLYNYINDCGGCKSMEDIKLCEDIVEDTLKFAPSVRNRLTLLRVMWLLDLPKEFYCESQIR